MDECNAKGSNTGYLRGASLLLLAQLLTLTAGLALHSIASHRLTAVDYGRFCVAHTFILVATHLLAGVLPRIFARHVSLNVSNLRVVWRAMFQLNLPACALFGLVLWMFRGLLSMGLKDDEMAPMLTWVSLVIVAQCGLLEPSWQILNGLREYGLQAILVVVHGLLRLGGVYAALVVWRHTQAGWGMIGLFIASVLSTLVTMQLLAGMVRNSSAIESGTKLEMGDVWEWLRLVPLVDVINYVLLAFNLSAVKVSVEDAAAVASYGACIVIAQTNIPICRAVSRGFYSFVAAASQDQERLKLGELMRSSLRIFLIGGSFQLAVMISIGDRIVAWFSGIAPPFPQLPALLVLGAGLLGIAFAMGELLVAAGALRGRLRSALMYGAVGVSMNLLLPGIYGIAGSAVALCLSGALAMVATIVIVRLVAGHLSLGGTALRCVGCTALAVWACEFLPSSTGFAGTCARLATVTVMFFLGLFIAREFTLTELRRGLLRYKRRPPA